MAPVGLHHIFSSFPAIINGHDSICIKGTQKHNQTKEYADCHRKHDYKRGKYKSQKYTADVSHKDPCLGEIEREKTHTACCQNDTHEKQVKVIQHKVGEIGHQRKTY